MIGFKGGIGKTSTAVHLACYLNQKGETLLVDGDPNRSASSWAERGKLPCNLCDETEAASIASKYKHIIIDTKARPEVEDLEGLINACDLMILPTTPDALALDALMLMVKAIPPNTNYKILLNIIPPKPSRAGDEAMEFLKDQMKLPMFSTMIRRYSAYQRASLRGVPVYESGDAKAKIAWADYQKLGAEVLKVMK
ncbi:ParA family protein [Nostoc sp. 2RC]|uniref:ParA family protein n=1 Tax=Nostoc sp. 2RC TaxID=2485484 RepID=UPI0028937DFB|nr:ParA family protein [Nostoc sp. 2RC]